MVTGADGGGLASSIGPARMKSFTFYVIILRFLLYGKYMNKKSMPFSGHAPLTDQEAPIER